MLSYTPKVVIAYASEDNTYRQKLENLLTQLKVTLWHVGNIQAGQVIQNQINDNLNEADIVLLLLSADFFVANNNLYDAAVRLHQDGKIELIPIYLRYCLWESSEIAGLQVLPKDKEPIVRTNGNQDYWLMNVAKEIQKVVKELQATRQIPATQLAKEAVKNLTPALSTADSAAVTQLGTSIVQKEFLNKLQVLPSLQKSPSFQGFLQNTTSISPPQLSNLEQSLASLLTSDDTLLQTVTTFLQRLERVANKENVVVIHGKNMVIGSSINAGGDVHIGDKN